MVNYQKTSFLVAALVTILLGISIVSCQKSEPIQISEKVIDVYQPMANFAAENQLKYDQEYIRAANGYDQKLLQSELNATDSLFALNQFAYCKLIINETKGLHERLHTASQLMGRLDTVPPVLIANFNYNLGRYYFLQHQPDSALHLIKLALVAFRQHYPPGHLKIAQALTLMPLIYVDLDSGYARDSIYHYTLQASNYFLRHSEIESYDWEMDYVLGLSSLLDRAHERGEYHSRIALEKLKLLPVQNKWLEASIWRLLGGMVKKRADALIEEDPVNKGKQKMRLYRSADTLFQKAIAIAKNNQDNRLMSFHEARMFNTLRFPDSTHFFNALEAFKQEFEGTTGWRPHYERLLGYYYFPRNPHKTIIHCNNFLKTAHQDRNLSYRDFAESYYFLRVTHRKLHQYDKAAHYAKKSLVLYGCTEEAYPIDRLDAVNLLDSTKRYCLITSGHFAQDLLEKYSFSKDLKDLILANTYFEYAEKHSFNSLFHADEDEFLTWQFETGTKASEKALEAANTAWCMTKDPQWVDRGLAYAENLKSYLLYRDMLKRTDATVDKYSLTDSIRFLQGELNQILFSFYEGKSSNQALLPKNHKVRQLRNLEYRRKNSNNRTTANFSNHPITVASIRSHLADREGMVHYYTSPKKLFGIYVDKDTSIFFSQEEDIKLFRENVKLYRASIEEEVQLKDDGINRYIEGARGMYEVLISPFSERLTSIDQLIVVPDQLLAPVPFEAFLSEAPDFSNVTFRTLPYLLQQTQIIYASSWKTFLINQEQKTSDFRNQSIGFWTTPELNAKNGLQVIEKSVATGFMGNYQVFSQRSGGKQSFLSKHQEFEILHLLLHASSSRINRYDNKIRFGTNEEDVIYGFEFYQHKFKAKLMVLASCESAAGAPQVGEGTFSLSRSLINSGIPEIVAAQFLIPQTTTGLLLDRFYGHLSEGKNAATAMHSAKLDYLKSVASERHAYPRFWAGMVVLN